jgi:OmpA-OmpF porin, OOP family
MKYVTAILFCYSALNVCAQNLVHNESFEGLDSCSAYYQNAGTIQYCSYWFTPYSQPFPNGGGSVEVFSECMPDTLFLTPGNLMGYQIPHTGTNYAGLWLSVGFNYREYLEGELIVPLQSGKRYCVRFWYSFANNYPMIVDGLGLVFTNDSLTFPLDSLGMVINIPTSVALDSGTLTFDTTNWILFDKTYVAQGGEKFFTIGNFKTNDETVMAEIGGGPLSYLSYIYLDDVSITLCDSPDAVLETPWWQTDLVLFPNPANELLEIKTHEPLEIITVFDAVGRVVYSSTDKIISTVSLATGVYVVRVRMKNGLVEYRQLVVHR